MLCLSGFTDEWEIILTQVDFGVWRRNTTLYRSQSWHRHYSVPKGVYNPQIILGYNYIPLTREPRKMWGRASCTPNSRSKQQESNHHYRSSPIYLLLYVKNTSHQTLDVYTYKIKCFKISFIRLLLLYLQLLWLLHKNISKTIVRDTKYTNEAFVNIYQRDN